jgi:DNA (cytosine-5)-methyltransferase 1
MTLTVGSLFSGIGGLDLGLERAGMTVKWHSEIDPYACRVLKKHWPDVPNLGNIKEINWKEVEKVDVICGGYPCQPFSTAGKRNGEEDPRHLWLWVREAISELRPRYAILENVRGHLSLGGLSVIGELASIGYDAEWRVISAASVGANHRRDRIVIVAYPNCCDSSDGGQCPSLPCEGGSRRDDGSGSGSDTGQVSVGGTRETPSDVAYTNNNGLSAATVRGSTRTPTDKQPPGQDNATNTQGRSRIPEEMANTASKGLQGCVGKVFEGNGTRSTYGGWQWWETEPDVGRVAHGIPSRVDRLRGLGNAVVPQVAEIVGRLIMEAHNEHL